MVMLGLLMAIVYSDYQKMQRDVDAKVLQMATYINDVENTTWQISDLFSNFVSQTPYPSNAATYEFAENLSRRYPFIYMISMVDRMGPDELSQQLSPNFILKELREDATGKPILVRRRMSEHNYVTSFVYPLDPSKQPILGLEVSKMEALKPLFELARPGLKVDAVNPKIINRALIQSFELVEGGYGLAINQVAEFADPSITEGLEKFTTVMISHQTLFEDMRRHFSTDTFTLQVKGDDGRLIGTQTPTEPLPVDAVRVAPDVVHTPNPVLPTPHLFRVVSTKEAELLENPIIITLSQDFMVSWTSVWLISVVLFLFVVSMKLFNHLHAKIDQKQVTLERVNRELSKNLNQQSDLLGYISHELNTPLTLISSPLQALQQSQSLSEEQQQHLKMIAKHTGKMQALVKNILDIKAYHRLVLQPVRLNFVKHISLVIESFQEKIYDANLHFRILGNQYDEIITKVDETSLRMTLDNLFSNAIKYNTSEGWIDVEWCVQDAQLVCKLRNAQVGITSEQCETMFVKFVRHNQKAHTQGYGLGLGLVADICRRNQWSIHAQLGETSESPKISGTYIEFVLRIPLID